MKKMNKKDADLANLMYLAREGLAEDEESLVENIVGYLIDDGLDRDQIQLFLETLLFVEQLPN